MAPEQRRQALLAVLALVLAGTAYRLWSAPPPATAAGGRPASNSRTGARAQNGPPAMTAPDVHLEALDSDRVEPGAAERNPFRFKPKPAPSGTTKPPVTSTAPTVPTGPPPPPTVPPIALKFIGIWEMTEQKRKVAVLTDGKGGVPIYGAEGDTVEGRYRIIRIGAESIEMAYLDGRGRQTIRLTGQ